MKTVANFQHHTGHGMGSPRCHLVGGYPRSHIEGTATKGRHRCVEKHNSHVQQRGREDVVVGHQDHDMRAKRYPSEKGWVARC